MINNIKGLNLQKNLKLEETLDRQRTKLKENYTEIENHKKKEEFLINEIQILIKKIKILEIENKEKDKKIKENSRMG